jgi:hypothetical protein
MSSKDTQKLEGLEKEDLILIIKMQDKLLNASKYTTLFRGALLGCAMLPLIGAATGMWALLLTPLATVFMHYVLDQTFLLWRKKDDQNTQPPGPPVNQH